MVTNKVPSIPSSPPNRTEPPPNALSCSIPHTSLATKSRTTVLSAIFEVCRHRNWCLLAAHVKTNHVHAVIEAEARPEILMNALKPKASRGLNQTSPARKRWARHGSTRYLWNDKDVQNAIRYIIDEQGDPMATYTAP